MKGYEDLVELLKKVQATGIISTDETSACDYQDMIGHSSLDQLHELATGTYKESFYRVYDIAFGTIETIRFYWQNSDSIQSIREERDDLKDEVERLEKETEGWRERTRAAEETTEGFREHWHKAENRRTDLVKQVKEQEAEIIRLKAKLYDMMTQQ